MYNGDLLRRDGLGYKPRSVEPFSGINRTWNENGQLKHEYTLKDGEWNGEYGMWHENGSTERGLYQGLRARLATRAFAS